MTNDKISDYKKYNERMELSLIDKAFFVDKIPSDVKLIVDYGCADGNLLNFLCGFYPNAQLVGYDVDEDMIQIACKNALDQNISFTSKWNSVEHLVNNNDGKTAVIASSLIHEVYSYGTNDQISVFWGNIYSTGFDYICIRDMMVSMSADRRTEINDVVQVLRKYHRTKALLDFEANWGSIENNKNFLHFILKYRYMEPNWDREVKENYLPLYREDFLSMIPEMYNVAFHEHYALPFLRRQVLKDMGVNLKDPTHIKIILEKEEKK
jgi:SAM-dependent methyltransferase